MQLSIQRQTTVMGQAGREFIVHITAHTVLCFVYVVRMVLIRHQCFGACTASRLLSTCPLHTQRLVGWGLARDWEGTLNQTDQEDITDHTTSCSAIKAEGKEVGEEFVVMVFVFQSNHYTQYGPAS